MDSSGGRREPDGSWIRAGFFRHEAKLSRDAGAAVAPRRSTSIPVAPWPPPRRPDQEELEGLERGPVVRGLINLVDHATAARLIDLGSDLHGGRMLQGHALMLAHRYDLAVTRITEAIRLRPDHDVGYRARGGAYLCLGRYAEAVEDYTKAVELGGPERGWELYKRG